MLGHLPPALLRLRGTGGAARLETHLRGPEQRLRGDAGPVGALAADQLALDQRRAQAQPGQARGGDLTGGTGTDDDGVEAFGHAHSS